MKWKVTLGAVAAVAAVALAAQSNSSSAKPDTSGNDAILASFERALNYEPAHARRVLRRSIGEDELYKLLNQVHWSRTTSAENDVKEVADDDQIDN